MTQHTQIVNIGDTDENADWIKTPENRKSEREIHEALEQKYIMSRLGFSVRLASLKVDLSGELSNIVFWVF